MSCTPPLEALGLWHFEEGTGDQARDASEYANDGTLVSMDSDLSWTPGKIGTGLVFDGVDDMVDCGEDPVLMTSDSLSVELWVRFDAFTTYEYLIENGIYQVFHRGSFAYDVVYFAFNIEEEDVVGDSAWASYVAVATTSQLVLGQWHHLVGVKDGNNIKFYLDGIMEKEIYCESCFTVDNSGASTLRLGRGFQGALDEVGIFSRPMSADEVMQRFGAGN